MKKILLILSLIFFVFCNVDTTKSFAATNITYYAKVENSSTYFYSLPIKNESYKLFEIPASYYVLLTGDENQNFYKAKYADVEGYVLKNSIIPVNEKPNYPFASSSFRIFSPTYLYSTTNLDGEKITPISSLSTVSIFYGELVGEELIPNSTNIWYYCSYLDETELKTGYIFSYFCDQFQKIQPSTEPFTPYEKELTFLVEDESITLPTMSSSVKAIIIISCIIPCLAIILLILKKRTPKNSRQRKIIRKPKRDYYEFNEDDI